MKMRMKGMWLLIIAMLATVAPQAVFGDGEANNSGGNLVKNGGFEEQLSFWNIPQGTAAVDSNVFRTEGNSLFYENNDPNQYELFMQDIPANPGETIHFSVWIKGEDIEQQTGLPPTSEDGAAVFVQSYDANNKYIDGVFPAGLLGTFDWQEVKGKAIIPPNAARVVIGLYLRPQTVGKVWFDDVIVQREMPQLMKTYLTYPNYRHIALSSSTEPWKVDLINRLSANETGFSILHEVRDENNQSVFMETLPATNGNSEIQYQPAAPLSAGKYVWRIELLDSEQQIRQSEQYEITVQQQMPQIYIDRDGFTVINNEKFFPLGTYLIRDWSHSNENLQKIADAGFNTLLSYTYGEAADAVQFLDRAHQYGFKVIYNLVDIYLGDEANNRSDGQDPFEVAEQYITDLKDHPALLAWYINDEFDLSWMPEFERMYQLIKELDPNHPVLQVSNTMGILEEYYPVTDVLATDPYPVGDHNGEDTDLTMTSTFAKHTANVTRGAKGMWMVAQMHDLSVYYDWRAPNQPNAEEMLNQAYQDLIHGSKGLIFYSFFDLWFPDRNRLPDEDTFLQNWPYVLQMMEQLEPVIPVIMTNQPVDLNVLDTDPAVEIAAFEHDQQLHLIMANPYYEAKSVTVAIPQGWKVQNQTQGSIASVVQSNAITFQLPAIGSGVFVLEKDLPDNPGSSHNPVYTLSNNTNLKSLELWAGGESIVINPTFDPKETAYQADTNASRIVVKASSEHPAAQVTYQDRLLRSEEEIELTEEVNILTLTVQAEDKSRKTYTLTVHKTGNAGGSTDEEQTQFDDIRGHWAESFIKRAAAAKLILGNKERAFKPDHAITRAEFTVMLINALQLEEKEGVLVFTDSGQMDSLAKKAVAQAVQLGIVNGYKDGSFRPDRPITRAEMAVMMARSFHIQQTATKAAKFADEDSFPSWAKDAIEVGRSVGIWHGRSNNRFMPDAQATRAETAVLLLRVLDLQK
ncbi:S-layer homology domain-containing protein [Paenibacillus sp. GXUN7292]|uniref:S-layer homology domain-containing protein n=1 Tax=Paenibacillus sp. GXUN7292 TaxID=3422499 RepID=UPI003D7EA216